MVLNLEKPLIIYGFQELYNNNERLDKTFLEKYKIKIFSELSPKDKRRQVIYGISCESIKEVNNIDKCKVEFVYDIVSKYRDYKEPTFLLGISINVEVDFNSFTEYNIEEE